MQMRCQVCAKGEARFWFAKEGFNIFRCESCFSAWVQPTPDSEFLKHYYRSSDGFETKDDTYSVSVTQKSSKRRRRAIQKHLATGVVLDVGCGRGFFLAEMHAHKYEVVGIELNPEDAEAARRRVQASIIEKPFLEAQFPPRAFDVINLDQCLEHLADPEKVLQRAYQLLKFKGLLSLAVPNHSSAQSRVMGMQDPYIMPPEHISFFTLSGLNELLTRVGFHVLNISTYGDLQGSSILHGLERLSPHPIKSILSKLASPSVERAVTFLAKPLTTALNLMQMGSIIEFYCVVEGGD